ncbi:GNAT family N-acetyltransferase [Parafrankia sp. BMG5.11]|uniref:GNAT family N-acetyltransferase n=1 Tax=Parafrankia sp. BMG5.11 TaxID=222540 RepID=UPI001038CA59|nr:GNAT family N-acetyltransferase [Parafrankia sp. BMG5.11]TCJ31740.1 GNAT family N-acetyltransferase [Parafrankia sp. BMG5.11]CAI7973548.1 GNAT family N-acetyltransferase [Frankia sp. Hr75.2]
MVIRSGRPGDVDELLAFWRHAADGTSVSDDPIGVGRLLAHDPEAVLVAELDEVMVGTVVAGWDGWRGHIYRLAVAPDHRRTGVARALLAAAHERFVALGAVLADAMVEDDNLDAHATYEKTGYRKQEGRTRWLRDLHTSTDRRD